jgi:type I restriction enzyme, S subunit
MMAMDGWKVVTIEECCEILDSKRIPVNAEEREKRIGDVPYYGANGIQGYIDDYIFDEDLILIAEDGGNFDQSAIRPIAYKIRGKSWVNNHAHVLKAKRGFCQDAVFYSLEHKDIQPFIVGGTRSKLNQGRLRTITIALPEPEKGQIQIATILSTIDTAIEQTEALIAKQQRIKTGLMQDLLTRGIDEHGNIRSEATHDFKDSPLGKIPARGR